jgi:hypothetical protein
VFLSESETEQLAVAVQRNDAKTAVRISHILEQRRQAYFEEQRKYRSKRIMEMLGPICLVASAIASLLVTFLCLPRADEEGAESQTTNDDVWSDPTPSPCADAKTHYRGSVVSMPDGANGWTTDWMVSASGDGYFINPNADVEERFGGTVRICITKEDGRYVIWASRSDITGSERPDWLVAERKDPK